MSTLDEERRREYYRIEDSVALEINPLDETASCAMPRITARLRLLSELHVSEFEAQHLRRQLDARDRVLNGFLKAMSKRIDLLGQVVANTALGELGTPQPVRLSEGGIQFNSAHAYTPDSRLSIKMVLMPQAAGMMLEARVVSCIAKAEGSFEIDTEFVDLPDAQRQLLARHVLQRQAQQRRQAREQNPAPDA